MNYFPNSIKKRKKENNKENKPKEDEETSNESSLSVEIKPMDYCTNIDLLVSGMKLGNSSIETFEHYQRKISKIIKQYKQQNKEVDFRIEKENSSSEEKEKDDDVMKIDEDAQTKFDLKIEKMKKIGKIGEEPTILDKESSTEDFEFKNEKLKVTAVGRFSSVRATNCVFKGKWCYEVTLLSNRLFQIGWCQLNTPFKYKDGIGDDITSYAYDGFRVRKWHHKKEKYGQNWDIGDIIGVCIDFENKKIEFFQNGISLGIAYENIPTGQNIAFFPGITLSKNEKAIVNFGNQKMIYNYQGYESLDIPQSIYKKSFEVTETFVDLVDTYILKFLNLKDKEVDRMFKVAVSSRIFNFFVNVSFKDSFIFSNLLLPYMIKISESTIKNDLCLFLETCVLYAENKIEFINSIFENLSSLIEQASVRRFEGINQREELIKLFLQLLKIEWVTQYWVEGRKYIDHLKLIISGNYLKTSEFINYLNEKLIDFKQSKKDFHSQKVFSEVYLEIRRGYEMRLEIEGINTYEEKINESMLHLLNYFLNDTRNFKSNNKTYTLRSILVEYYTKSSKESSMVNNDIMMGGTPNPPNESFIKYYYFNMLEILTENFKEDLSNFSIEPWLSRNKNDSLYYDEVGIGGTILHVTSEYGSKIDDNYKVNNIFLGNMKNNNMNYLLHRILNLTSSYILPVLKDYQRNYDRCKDHTLDSLEQDGPEKGLHIHSLFRSYLSVLTRRNQTILYKFSYFLINWINSLIKSNKDIVYFIPKSIMQIPYEIFKVLMSNKSFILEENSEERKMVNLSSPYFKEDNYIYQILYFYCSLFNDNTIANPEFKEGFIFKISNFIKTKRLLKVFQENEDLIEMLMKGLLMYMGNEMMCHYASENMVKIIKPICFGENKDSSKKVTLINVVKKFFENNSEIFQEFMHNYYKLLNKVMTDYTVSLTEASKQVPNQQNRDIRIDHSYTSFKKLKFAYGMLCDLIKILEFLLAAYPNEFFDITTINFSRFSNILKNLSSRILDKTYFDKLTGLMTKNKLEKLNSELVNSVIGIFLNINENKNNSNFSEFVNKLVSLSDFDVEPFLKLLLYIKPEESLQQGYTNFTEIINYLLSLKLNKVEKQMTEEEWEITMKRDDICIICYVNESDRILIPCKHGCCNECLMQYLIDKKHCFICNAAIEKTEHTLTHIQTEIKKV